MNTYNSRYGNREKLLAVVMVMALCLAVIPMGSLNGTNTEHHSVDYTVSPDKDYNDNDASDKGESENIDQPMNTTPSETENLPEIDVKPTEDLDTGNDNPVVGVTTGDVVEIPEVVPEVVPEITPSEDEFAKDNDPKSDYSSGDTEEVEPKKEGTWLIFKNGTETVLEYQITQTIPIKGMSLSSILIENGIADNGCSWVVENVPVSKITKAFTGETTYLYAQTY